MLFRNKIFICLLSLIVLSCGSSSYAAETQKAEEKPDYFAKNRHSMVYDVVLYGHEFTLDSYLVSYDEQSKWTDVGYLIPQILPKIEGDQDQRSMRSIIATLERAQNEYRDLADAEIQTLAKKLEEGGHIGLFPKYDAGVWEYQPRAGDPIIEKNTPERRIRFMAAELREMIDNKTLDQAIAAYNDAREQNGKEGVSPEMFANAKLFSRYDYAAFGLRTMVMASPQMQSYLHSQAASSGKAED